MSTDVGTTFSDDESPHGMLEQIAINAGELGTNYDAQLTGVGFRLSIPLPIGESLTAGFYFESTRMCPSALQPEHREG